MEQLLPVPGGFKLALQGPPPFGHITLIFMLHEPDEVEISFNLGGMIHSTRRAKRADVRQLITTWQTTLQNLAAQLA